MKILVTGGAGFIGSHIVDECIAAGHSVVVLDNLSTGRTSNLHPDAEFVCGDVRDHSLVSSLMHEGRFDLVNHHAAQLDVRVSVRNPQLDAETNIIGSLNLLQSAVETGARGFIFASSGGTVYGDQRNFPADEEHPTDPVSPYGVAKLAVEKYSFYFRHQHGLESVALRYTNVYGPRQNPHGEAGVVAIFCDRLQEGRQAVINGDGNQTRDYIYVGDVVRANMLAMASVADGRGGGVFNVCSDTETSVTDVFDRLNGLFGAHAERAHGPAQPGEQLRSRCSWMRIHRTWGWSPETSLEEGLRRTVESYRTGT